MTEIFELWTVRVSTRTVRQSSFDALEEIFALPVESIHPSLDAAQAAARKHHGGPTLEPLSVDDLVSTAFDLVISSIWIGRRTYSPSVYVMPLYMTPDTELLPQDEVLKRLRGLRGSVTSTARNTTAIQSRWGRISPSESYWLDDGSASRMAWEVLEQVAQRALQQRPPEVGDNISLNFTFQTGIN